VRIGIGHPGSKDLVHGYVLHDFAKADAAWLEPLLDAIADAAGRLAAGDDARFLTDVARTLQGDAKPKSGAAEPARGAPSRGAAEDARPAGERRGKRTTAFAENLRRWLKGRSERGD
jgi:PTH1 family peptidyl-tRNA hydrolase